MNRSGRSRTVAVVAVAAWLAAIVIPPVAVSGWRAQRLAELSQPDVQTDWDSFREAMRQESGTEGPVQRKVPKSAEPPELVWLRDFFWLAVAAWVALVGVLGGFVAILVMGVSGGTTPPATSRESAPR